METLLQDLRYGWRTLKKSPGFTFIAVLTLALGIGANTAMFSIVNGVLLRAVPYAAPDRLLKVYARLPEFPQASVSYPNFLDWQRRSRAVESMAAYRNEPYALTGVADPERLRGFMASSSFLDVLGIKPVIGRYFTADEDQRGAAPVVVLTSNIWKRRFGGDASILGKSITMNEQLYTVIGVVPSDNVVLDRVAVLTPIGQWSEKLFWKRDVGMGMRVIARMKAGATLPQTLSEFDSIARQLEQEYPRENKNRGIGAVTLTDDIVGDVRTPLIVLLVAVGFVLLIACANVANLLLARATARRREFAIRGALGATRLRMVRQLLTEGLLLSIGGGALGLSIAFALDKLFIAKLATHLPRAADIHLDAYVLAFTAFVSLLASLVFGITPAVQSARCDVNETLKETGRGNSGRHGLQRTLVVVEVAMALVLTLSAGLMIRTMTRLWSINPGFDADHVLTFGIAGSPAVRGAPAAVRNGFRVTSEKLRSVPGVEAASMSLGSMPMSGDSDLGYWVVEKGKPSDPSQMDDALFYGVDGDYLKVMHVPLLRGRFLTEHDDEHSPCVTVIDTELQKKAFGDADPIGQHLSTELLPMNCEIVGIVGHMKQWGLDQDATSKVRSQMYFQVRQFPDSVMDLASRGSEYVVRTKVDPYSVVPALKRATAEINGRMVLYGEQTYDDIIKESMAARRFTRLLLGVFAALALALAAVGIYGVVSYHVTQSTHEIGVRMALGADANSVLAMVLRSSMRLSLLGIVVGAVAGAVATRALKSLLYGVSAADPVTFVAVAVVLCAVTLLASYIPARRATRIDPMVALRYE